MGLQEARSVSGLGAGGVSIGRMPMRKLGIVLVASVVAFSAVGCGGPYMLSNSVGDWYNDHYGETPWLYGNILSNAIFGLVFNLARFGDAVFVNTYYFWAKDAQPAGDGKGTVFEHKAATHGKKLK